ncbi:MAG: hypothetical protein K5769_07055 [Pseudobutyrivibrio sp.]|nr:hypothetical protein [Pseudobutyrivibrio sp.]
MGDLKVLEAENKADKKELEKLVEIFKKHGFGIAEVKEKRNLLVKYHDKIAIHIQEKDREKNGIQQMMKTNSEEIEKNVDEIERLKEETMEMEKELEESELPLTLREGIQNKIERNINEVSVKEKRNDDLNERNYYLSQKLASLPDETQDLNKSMNATKHSMDVFDELLHSVILCKEIEDKKMEFVDFVKKHGIEWKKEDSIEELNELFPMIRNAETQEQLNTTNELKIETVKLVFNEDIVCDKSITEEGTLSQEISTKDVKMLGMVESSDDKLVGADLIFADGGLIQTAADITINLNPGLRLIMKPEENDAIELSITRDGRPIRDYVVEADGELFEKIKIRIGKDNAYNTSFSEEYYY